MSSTSFQTRDMTNQGRSSSATPSRSAGSARQTEESRSSQEQIAKRAYEIWMSHGRPQGQAVQHWQQAEQELQRTSKPGRA